MEKKINSKPLELKPVIYLSAPKYPNNTQFDVNDIFKMIPKRWQQSRIASVLLTTVFISAILGGCSKSDHSTLKPYVSTTPSLTGTTKVTPALPTKTASVVPQKPMSKDNVKATPSFPRKNTVVTPPPLKETEPDEQIISDKTQSKIAPVFQGGDGFVSYGDSDEPVYYAFTEEESFEFIKSILENQNIQIERSDKKLPEIQLPLRGSRDDSYYSRADKKYPLEFDAVVHGKSKDVFIEFVSRDDHGIEAENPEDDYSNTDTQIGANLLQTELKIYGDKHNINAAVFYDPIGDIQEETQEQLKEQIKQFISWMKAEGII